MKTFRPYILTTHKQYLRGSIRHLLRQFELKPQSHTKAVGLNQLIILVTDYTQCFGNDDQFYFNVLVRLNAIESVIGFSGKQLNSSIQRYKQSNKLK